MKHPIINAKTLADWFENNKPRGFKYFVNDIKELQNEVSETDINVTLDQEEVKIIVNALRQVEQIKEYLMLFIEKENE